MSNFYVICKCASCYSIQSSISFPFFVVVVFWKQDGSSLVVKKDLFEELAQSIDELNFCNVVERSASKGHAVTCYQKRTEMTENQEIIYSHYINRVLPLPLELVSRYKRIVLTINSERMQILQRNYTCQHCNRISHVVVWKNQIRYHHGCWPFVFQN